MIAIVVGVQVPGGVVSKSQMKSTIFKMGGKTMDTILAMFGLLVDIVGVIGIWISIGPHDHVDSPSTGSEKSEVVHQPVLGTQNWLSGALIGIACCVAGALPNWASQSGLLRLLSEDTRNGISNLANWTTLAVLVLLVVYSVSHKDQLMNALRSRIPNGEQSMRRSVLVALAILAVSYVVVAYQELTMMRIWAANQDTQVIWLLAALANFTIVSYCLAVNPSRSLVRASLVVMGAVVLVLGAYNLGYIFFRVEGGDISWSIRNGVMEGGFAVVIGGIITCISGMRIQKGQAPSRPE